MISKTYVLIFACGPNLAFEHFFLGNLDKKALTFANQFKRGTFSKSLVLNRLKFLLQWSPLFRKVFFILQKAILGID